MKISELYTTELHEAGSEVQILDDQGNETGLFITVMGMDSKEFRQHTKIHQKAYLESLREKKDFDEEAMMIRGLLDCTVGWRGTDEKFTKKLCGELYTKAPYIRDQLDTFMGARENFTKAKPKS